MYRLRSIPIFSAIFAAAVPAGEFSIWGDGTLEDSGLYDPVVSAATEIPVADLPDECLLFLMGSRYCETDRLSQFAWDRFGHIAPGWSRVQAICNFTNKHITFGYQNARNTRTAYEAFEEKVGVCRDYAHLAITLLRCMNIPARYVNGYLGDIGVPILDPQDFSARSRSISAVVKDARFSRLGLLHYQPTMAALYAPGRTASIAKTADHD